ncbi:MAG: glycosyl transferase [Flavobacteriales bacterium]|nr:glycosyl transferase [Flavobacteriales bacterium]OUW94633.1 MAG: hypothetical protein CBD88_05515 [Flavobacteriales bacterium TMED228]|tara:strand:- start:1179 stop:2285 length:1107 start_codon:yes stop_codon:yes gene_type:complete
MKIAILGTRGIPNNYGGFEQCAESLSIGLVKRGHEVTVYNPNFHPFKENNYLGVKIEYIYSPQNIIGTAPANFVFDYLCLKHAIKNQYDIILELGLITAAPAIILCDKKTSIVVTNLDGLEWKRAKWSSTVRVITKALEKFGVLNSNFLVADNIAIQEYIKHNYNVASEFIAYGTEKVGQLNKKTIVKHLLFPDDYILTIARLEPENNLELMCDAYLLSDNQLPYYIIGNYNTKYGTFLKKKYKNTNIHFLGAIFNKEELDTFRFFASYYLHGHSVGGTNPALIEAMAAQAFVIVHDNPFNKSVVSENTFSFNNKEELKLIFEDHSLLKQRKEIASENLKIINSRYRWDLIIEKYEKYFLKILGDKKI